jgi:hypothetical protein
MLRLERSFVRWTFALVSGYHEESEAKEAEAMLACSEEELA